MKRDKKENNNRNSTMATASDADIFINTIQFRISFCTRFHYNLLKPCAKGNTVHLPISHATSSCFRRKLTKQSLKKNREQETVYSSNKIVHTNNEVRTSSYSWIRRLDKSKWKRVSKGFTNLSWRRQGVMLQRRQQKLWSVVRRRFWNFRQNVLVLRRTSWVFKI